MADGPPGHAGTGMQQRTMWRNGKWGRCYRWAVGCVLAAMACAAPAQWASNRGYQLLQRIDDVLFGVDNLSLQILDRTHVAGTLLEINVHRPYPVRSRMAFVADCGTPMRLAIRSGDTSAAPVLGQLEFADLSWLDGSWAAAEFACESTRQPGRAAQLAREMFEHGGPPDAEVLYCELQPDGSTEVRKDVEVRFSPSANAVSVNRQWLSSGSVTGDEVRFGANSVWRINRQALDVRRTTAGGEMLFSGRCERRPSATGGTVRQP